MRIARHRTAISRTDLSTPVRLALADGILTAERSLFDYGCGLGDDLRRLSANGIRANGWDPFYRPHQECLRAAIVNLGYVINVIEDPIERQAVLRSAWSLAEQVLIVSARLVTHARYSDEGKNCSDGIMTSRGTFQKFYDQEELRLWIDKTLGVSAVAAAPGVFYVFRDEQARSQYVVLHFRRPIVSPRESKSAVLFDKNKRHLTPLMDFFSERGRLPFADELPNTNELVTIFGSIRRAFRVVLRVTDRTDWDLVTTERSQDLLVYLALAHFGGRPTYQRQPVAIRRDVKALFSSYRNACDKADQVLFSLGQPGVLAAACDGSEIGKLTPNALYVHESALTRLSITLRLYEGCARRYLGRVEGANVVKLYRYEPKVSYLSYPDFMTEPHPMLAQSTTVHLQTGRVGARDYSLADNRPILHRKELFVARDHSQYSKWARLTRFEEKEGLFNSTDRIGLRNGWEEALARKGLFLRGHRLLSTKKGLG